MSPHPLRPIALNPLFNPQLLPGIPPLRDDIVGWQWLADPQTTTFQRDAYLARHVSGHGHTDPTARDLVHEPRTPEELVAGHLAQHVFFDLVGAPTVRLRLSAGDPESDPDGPAATPGCPFAGPVAIIGTSVPAALAGAAVGRQLAGELSDALNGRRITAMPAMAADPGREWTDPVLLVDYADALAVRLAAAVHLQPFISVWRPSDGNGRLDVIDLADPVAEIVVAGAAADLRQVVVRTCPLIPGSGCGELCRMHGGPWVSRSIRAASRWERRRARMIRALGCDTCGDGSITVFGTQVLAGRRRAISIAPEVATPTRFDRVVPALDER